MEKQNHKKIDDLPGWRQEVSSLSARQRKILDCIREFQKKKGYPPSIREIGKAVNLSSSSTVWLHLKTLEEKNFIKRDPEKSRSIEVLIHNESTDRAIGKEEIVGLEADKLDTDRQRVYPNEDASEIFNIGRLRNIETPGFTLNAVSYGIIQCPLLKGFNPEVSLMDPSNVEEIIPIPEFLTDGRESFILKMPDESMEYACILRGDLCIFHTTFDVADGEIAAIFSGDETVIRRVFKFSNSYKLQPENRRMKPVFVKEIRIMGKLVGIIRSSFR